MESIRMSEFLGDCELRGVTKRTLANYRSALKIMSAFMDEGERSITPEHLTEWAQHLQANGYSPNTITQHRRMSLLYLHWAQENATNGTDYTACIKAFAKLRAPRCVKTRYALTIEQMQELLKQPNTRRYKGLRDRCVIELCYATLRISEVLALTYEDIDLDSSMLRIRDGKGGKERYVPLPARTGELVRRYIGDVCHYQTVFPVGLDTFRSHFHAYTRAAGLADDVTPHWLRHTGATHMYRAGCPLAYLSKILGHSKVSTTEIYLSVQVDDLLAAMNYHPMAG